MKKMKCPNCEKRVFDISKLPNERIEIELKCPNCRKFVNVACTAEACLNSKKLSGV